MGPPLPYTASTGAHFTLNLGRLTQEAAEKRCVQQCSHLAYYVSACAATACCPCLVLEAGAGVWLV
jgi:hypothetical protein